MPSGVFISYAGEDQTFASELAGALKSISLPVWYAPDQIGVGERILEAVERGLTDASHGILILSKAYLRKPWPKHELNRLFVKSIEEGAILLPVWLGIDKVDVSEALPSLSDVYAARFDGNLQELIRKLLPTLRGLARTQLLEPSYETLEFRFLSGQADMLLAGSQCATTVWELIRYSDESAYPIAIGAKVYPLTEIYWRAATYLPHNEDRVRRILGNEGYNILIDKLCMAGFDPKHFS